jgi:hypothetical protein
VTGAAPHPPQPPVQLPDGVQHRSLRAYQAYKCRCRDCQEHKRAYDRTYNRRRRARQIRNATPVPEGVTHGRQAYNYYRCRCDVCVEDRGRYDQERWLIRKQRNKEAL